jgi:hypothetical protein
MDRLEERAKQLAASRSKPKEEPEKEPKEEAEDEPNGLPKAVKDVTAKLSQQRPLASTSANAQDYDTPSLRVW